MKRKITFVVKYIFLTIIFVFLGNVIQGKEGPRFLVDIDRFEECKDIPNIAMPLEDMKFYKINRTTRAFSFSTHLTRPLDENVGLKTELQRWGTHGWTKVPFMPLQPDACNLFHKLLGKVWTEMKRSMGVKEPEKCPIPVVNASQVSVRSQIKLNAKELGNGNYGLKNYTYDTTHFAEFVPFKGKFRYTVLLVDTNTGEPLQCLVLVINVTDAN